MWFEWPDYSGIPDTPTRNIKFSERECNFLLSLLIYSQDRDKWPDISDADWDTVEDWLSEIDTKLMGAF